MVTNRVMFTRFPTELTTCESRKWCEVFILLSCLRYPTTGRHLSGCEIIITPCLLQGEERLLKIVFFSDFLMTKELQVEEIDEAAVQVSIRELQGGDSVTVQQGSPSCQRDAPG